MLDSKYIPSDFKVISIQPYIQLEYRIHIMMKILLTLFFLPFLLIFVGHCYIVLFALYEVVHLRFFQAVRLLSYDTDNPLMILVLLFVLCVLTAGLSYGFLWAFFGKTELKATREALTIKYQMFGITKKMSLSPSQIRYFSLLFRDEYWVLEAVTSQRQLREIPSFPGWWPKRWRDSALWTRVNYKCPQLYSQTTFSPTQWLGKLLADFYEVDLQIIRRPSR